MVIVSWVFFCIVFDLFCVGEGWIEKDFGVIPSLHPP